MTQISKVPFSVKLPSDHIKIIKEIVKRTGETKTDLFQRIIETEYKRITTGASISDDSNAKQLEEIKQTLLELSPIIKKNSETSQSILDGVNKIYCGVLFALKEIFRIMHFTSRTFAESSLLQKSQLAIIIDNSNQDANNTYASVYKILSESKPRDIVETLRNK